MVAPYRIKFRGQTNIDFDLLCDLSFDSDHGNTDSFLAKESMSSNVYDGSRRNVHGYRYTDVMNVSFTLIKRDYTDITDRERRKIIAWLTGSNKVEELTIYKDDSEVVSYRLLGGFTNIEHYKMANNRDVGVVATFEHIAPYAYSPVKTRTINVPEDEQPIIIKCRTDVYEKPLYPKIQVTIGDSLYLPITEDPTVDTYEMLDNTVYKYNNAYYVKVNGQKQTVSGIFATNIENQTTDADTYGKYYLCSTDRCVYKSIIDKSESYAWEMISKVGVGFEIKNTYYENGKDITVKSSVVGCDTNKVITLDGDNRIISSSETPMRIFGDSFNWEWIYFVPGENHIEIAGDCTVTFQWVEPIKIGNM